MHTIHTNRALAVMAAEADAILLASARLTDSFSQAVQLLTGCTGSIVVCGVGKAGLIGQKVSATLASTGTRSFFLHPTEALHGDLGRIGPQDAMLVFSQSGETEEVLRLLAVMPPISLIAVTSTPISTLARKATCVLAYGQFPEACHLGLAPTTSTAVMLAIGDALAVASAEQKAFGKQDFARYHPGGSLGKRLVLAKDRMRPLQYCRVANSGQTIRSAYAQHTGPRRSGATLVVEDSGSFAGLFTDSDMVRLLESGDHKVFDLPLRDVMTVNPTVATTATTLVQAVALMSEGKYSELPIVDDQNKLVGLLDLTDVVGMDQFALA